MEIRALHDGVTRTPGMADATTLIVQFEGFMDAGQAGAGAVQSLVRNLSRQTVTAFDVDQLLDYRSRRPPMDFTGQHFSNVTWPELTLSLYEDLQERPFYLLTGPEPDFQWQRFCASVRDLAQELQITLVVTGQGVPWAAPHTRPLRRFTHASRPGLIGDRPTWSQGLKVPGYLAGLLELTLDGVGIDTVGQSVQVPHYLSDIAVPQAAVSLLEGWSDITGLSLPVGDLPDLGLAVMSQIHEQVSASAQLSQVVSDLEHAYDGDLTADLPMTMDDSDIAEQVEQFLRDIGGGDED